MDRGAWRLLRDPPGSALWNMSVDEALLCCIEDAAPVLRLYAWARPSLSLGYRQAEPDCLRRCGAHGVELVRRATGGGTVLHGRDLSYAVAAPCGHPDLPRGMLESYAWIRDVVVSGLRAAGLDARASSTPAGGERSEVCFAASTSVEIEVDSHKIVGSAQRRTRWGFLQHGSIRLGDDGALYRALFGMSPPAPAVPPVQASQGDLAEALVDAFASAVGQRPVSSGLTDRERNLATEGHSKRRRNPLSRPALSSRRPAGCADRLP